MQRSPSRDVTSPRRFPLDSRFEPDALRARVLSVAPLIAFVLISAVAGFAQSSLGTIQGTVRDSSGAVVPGATVHVTATATSVITDVTTNGAGFYIAPSLIAGEYRVETQAPGFREVAGRHDSAGRPDRGHRYRSGCRPVLRRGDGQSGHGQLCDWLGMGRFLGAGCVFHTAGVLLTISATGFWSLWCGTLCLGMGNALVEAAINPLVATLYPDRKTEKLNAVHAWFPCGIVSGGLAAYAFTTLHLGWQAKTCLILIPTFGYGAAFLRQRFPRTERVQQGVPTSVMYRQAMRPRFVLWIGCMLLTASAELGPNQWIPDILTKTAALSGILVLVWINGLMVAGRLLARRPIEKLSPLGVLTAAATLTAAGLISLSLARSAGAAMAASTIFALGVCYFWPTMLGVTADWFPKGGSLLLAMVGGAGNLSVALILPLIGRMYDASGPSLALRQVAVLPLALIVIFSVIGLRTRRQALAATAL